MATRLMRVCSVNKLWLLKYAKKKDMKCYPRNAGRIVESREGTVKLLASGDNTVWCCGKRLGRHRKRGGTRKRRAYDWKRAYRAHASRRRKR